MSAGEPAALAPKYTKPVTVAVKGKREPKSDPWREDRERALLAQKGAKQHIKKAKRAEEPITPVFMRAGTGHKEADASQASKKFTRTLRTVGGFEVTEATKAAVPTKKIEKKKKKNPIKDKLSNILDEFKLTDPKTAVATNRNNDFDFTAEVR